MTVRVLWVPSGMVVRLVPVLLSVTRDVTDLVR